MHEYKIKYCDIYDYQIFSKDSLRVSTPLHAEASKTTLLKLKEQDPTLYNGIMSVFPDVELQVRYYGDMKKNSKKINSFEDYPHTWEGVLKYAEVVTSGDDILKLKKKIITAKRAREKNKDKRPLGGYPILHVFEVLQSGGFKRYIEAKRTDELTEKYFEFEGLNIQDYVNKF